MVARDITLMGLSLTNCSNTGPRIMAASTPRCGQVVARQYLMIEPAHREWAGLCWYNGSHGVRLGELARDKRMLGLPSHARVDEDQFPNWKVQFIRQNREIYRRNRAWINRWVPSILPFPSSLQKLEWNCKGGE